MLSHVPESTSKLILHTGNMLHTTDVTKQVHMAATEQILEGLTTSLRFNEKLPEPVNGVLQVKPPTLLNQSDEDKKNLQSMIKVFVNSENINSLKEALEYTISDLQLPCIDSVILSYQGKSIYSESLLNDLLQMWKVLEEFVSQGSVCDIGISDVDTETFTNLYNAVQVKPSIHQINLSACCVVPPDLQEFCRERDIRILTHNDPADILPPNILNPLFHGSNSKEEPCVSSLQVMWVTRFQAHIKCRGILSNKGYIVCLDLK